MNPITSKAIELWKKLPSNQLGDMPYTYNIRVRLFSEFPNVKRKTIVNCSQQAVRILKHQGKA